MDDAIRQARSFLGTQPWIVDWAWAAALAVITYFISRAAAHAVAKLLHQDSNPLPTSTIIINIVRGAIWIAGASVILNACFGIDTNALVAALGVGGIAVSLGFQDTLSNIIGGLQVTFMGIVKPGDNIEIGTEAGVVQDVTWRHTTIRDAMGQTVIVPNSVISKNALVHLLPAGRVSVPFAVSRFDTLHNSVDLDELASSLVDISRECASEVSPLIVEPKVFFGEVTELGIKGKIIFQIEDDTKTSSAADAVVRAIVSRIG